MYPKKKNKKAPLDFPIPAGTEQETGFTRALTEKVIGHVQIIKSPDKKQRRRK